MANEPKDDGILGRTACGLVVRNRILAGWESQDWVAVIRNHQDLSNTVCLSAPSQSDRPVTLHFGRGMYVAFLKVWAFASAGGGPNALALLLSSCMPTLP